MAIETTLQPRQKWWNILYAFICGGLALWGAYDYWVSIPEREQQFALYESNKQRHEELAGKATQGSITEAERAEYATLEKYFQDRAERNLPVPTNPPAYDRPVQMWLYIVGCGVMGVPWFLWQWLSVAGKRYRLDDDGTLTAPGHAPIPAARIADIDMSKWMAKSIATVRTTDGHAILLDDYKFRGTDLIVGAIAARFYPDDWTPDGRDLKRLRLQEAEAAAEQSATGGDGGSTAGTA
jgi:hypothetical protein